MDFTSGISTLVKPIQDINVGANYANAQKAGQDVVAKNIENEKARYAQDLTYKLQTAIHNSYNEKTKRIDYDRLQVEGNKLGIDQQTMAHAIENLPKVWSSALETAQSKTGLAAASPDGAAQLNTLAGTTMPDQTQTAPTATQSTSTATAVPVSAEDKTGFTTPDMVQKDTPMNHIINEDTHGASAQMGVDPTLAPVTTEQAAANAQNLSRESDAAQTGWFGTVDRMKTESPIPTDLSTLYSKKTSKDIEGLPMEEKMSAIRGLRNAGITLPSDKNILPSNIDTVIAEGLNQVQGNAVSNLYKGYNPMDPKTMGTAYSAKSQAPKAAQDAVADIFNKGREIKTTKLGNKATEQATGQAALDFKQKQDLVKVYLAKGYKATMGNIDKLVELEGKSNMLTNTLVETGEIRAEAGKLTDDQFNSKVETLLTGSKLAESIGTEAGQQRFMSKLRQDRSFGEMIGESTSFKDFLGLMAKNHFSSQQRTTMLDIIDGMVHTQIKTGVTKSALDAFKKKEAKAESAKLGSQANPYPVGQEPAIGEYYTHKDGSVRKRTK